MNADDIRRYLASSDAADVSADVAASALRHHPKLDVCAGRKPPDDIGADRTGP